MARYGMLGHVKFTFQNTFGLIDSTSSQAFPIVDESLTKNIDRITRNNLKARLSKTKTEPGKRGVQGAVNMHGFPSALAYGLKSVLQNTSTFSSNGAFTHNFMVGCDDYNDFVATSMLTVEVNRDEGANSQFYQDMNGNSLVINIETGELVRMELGLLGTGQQETTKTAVNYLAEKPFKFDQCSISLDGAAELDFQSLSFSINNNLEARNTLVNTFSAQKIKRTEEVGIEVSGSLIVQSNSYWSAFTDQTEHQLNLNMKNSDGNELNISIPNLSLVTFDSNIAGLGVINASFTAEAFYNTGSNSALGGTIVSSTALFQSPFILDDAYYGKLDQSYNLLF